MRDRLHRYLDRRACFTGTFAAYGGAPVGGSMRQTRTMLVTAVTDANGQPVADHCWLRITDARDLQAGMRVAFSARVTMYLRPPGLKRTRRRRYDYRMTDVRNVEVVR